MGTGLIKDKAEAMRLMQLLMLGDYFTTAQMNALWREHRYPLTNLIGRGLIKCDRSDSKRWIVPEVLEELKNWKE